MVKVTFKHWKSGEYIDIIGEMPDKLNNNTSDRFVIVKEDGTYEDIIKSTVVKIETL